ncbi:MAG: PhnD/SsuA/transferrin family substrate-binding protein [Desulfuromonadales bacterium]|nr:PhnD/SsuA/transferrin family substrate-binding protein [Desulfuromonadales bacterium]
MKPFLIYLTVLMVILQPSSVLAEQAVGAPKVLRVGFSAKVFPDVDQRDAQIAMEIWTRELSRGMGIKTPPQTSIFKNSGDLLDAVKRGNLTFVTLSALEFLQIRDKAPMAPAFVNANNAGAGRQYVLVVRQDSGIRSVADLGGKTVTLLSKNKHEASHIWLDVLLMRTGHRDRSLFFRQTRESASASQAIMGVFFKQSDAALISHASLETNKALNPQVGKQLTSIAISKGLHGDISCIPTMVDETLKRTMENAALHLHETTVGKQIFTLFQTERIIPFNPSYLDGIVELLRERDRLLAKLPRKR